ncbi:MAG: adenosylmethionine--8-amino-7-oxononanoate transaminase [Helicobacteraceae bacterium]|jgi:adenosylmethionine-8-amino-7-oxononanoate aminotransferase|nr:adenosylmethionine--8-amino-7-oxononanoate transaminase [Helicobacteraceae bacterium]
METHDDLIRRDLAVIWHPCSQMSEYIAGDLPLAPIASGEGAWLVGTDGRRYLDAISSWWVNLFGHANKYIASVVAAQAHALEHCIFAGFTHKQAIRLAERIIKIAPRGLTKVFFADNGSAAVEVAIKMAFHIFANRGEQREIIVSLAGGYHGETLGALAAGDVEIYRETYAPLLFKGVRAKSPAIVSEAEALDDLRRILSENKGKVCAVIAEPLVQCAGAMAMFEPSYLCGLRSLCDEFGVLWIADEIATGFGRTGAMFACDLAGVTPDLMTLSKGLTGGFLPLALTLARAEIYDEFARESYGARSFLHSHSYSGNPLACAAANASLDIFENRDVIGDNAKLGAAIDRRLSVLRGFSCVSGVRRRGMIAAFEADFAERGDSLLQGRALTIKIINESLVRGIILRPLGNTIYIMPPYIITAAEIDLLFDQIEDILKTLENYAAKRS